MAWDRSNWYFQKGAQTFHSGQLKQVLEKWCKEDPVVLPSLFVKTAFWFHAIETMVSRSGSDVGPWNEDLHSLQQDLNGAVNMFSSLLRLRSKESVTGGFMVKPLVQSHCKVLWSMQLGALIKCWVAYQKNARGAFWRWRFTRKPQIALFCYVLCWWTELLWFHAIETMVSRSGSDVGP